jgi:hypothetical protein
MQGRYPRRLMLTALGETGFCSTTNFRSAPSSPRARWLESAGRMGFGCRERTSAVFRADNQFGSVFDRNAVVKSVDSSVFRCPHPVCASAQRVGGNCAVDRWLHVEPRERKSGARHQVVAVCAARPPSTALHPVAPPTRVLRNGEPPVDPAQATLRVEARDSGIAGSDGGGGGLGGPPAAGGSGGGNG